MSAPLSDEIQVDSIKGYTEEITRLLENTVLGTPGKLRYKVMDITHNLKMLDGLEFIRLRKGRRVLGTVGVVKRTTNTGNSLYLRYLSVFSPQRVSEQAKTNLKNTKNSRAKQLIAEELSGYFAEQFIAKNESGCFYAYVESGNFQSQNLCETFGFRPVRAIKTLLFSRFYPTKHAAVSKVDKSETGGFEYSLQKFYENHSFVFTNRLAEFGNLYHLKNHETAVAGLRAKPVVWKLIEIPGFKGFMMQHILPKLPLFRKLFNSENLKFLAFDCVWYLPGHENDAILLMEHVCTQENIHLGLFWGDTESDISKFLAGSGKLGLINKIAGSFSARLMIRPVSMTPKETEELLEKPVFVSAVDTT